ncbi:MAG: hypothetical protein QM627_12390 [Luteolibacter sp.]
MAHPRMTLSRRITSLIACGVAVFSIQTASAHQFWIERTEGKFIVRFGHTGSKDEKAGYEKSPGALDKLQGVSTWTQFPEQSGSSPEIYKVKNEEDGFSVEEAPAKLPFLAQGAFPVRKWAGKDGKPDISSYTTAFARWQPATAEAKPVTTLDLLPSTEKGKATLYFKGKPLAGHKVTLFASNLESASLETDAQGVVSIPADAKGDVILWAHHSEPAEGTFLGSSYNSLGYTITLSYKFND